MERTKLLTFAVVGLLVLNLATLGFIWLKPDRPPRPEQPGGRPPVDGPARLVIERLHFDEQQQRQYLQLVAQHQQQIRTLNGQLIRLYTSYYDLLKAAQIDTIQANTLSQQIAANQQTIAKVNLAHFGQLKALCRTDQRGDFNRMVDDLAELFGRLVRPSVERPPVRPAKNSPPRP
jgi:Spy/CpxP family protein refolding chaperone